MFLHFFFCCSDKTLTKPTHGAGKGWGAQLSLQLSIARKFSIARKSCSRSLRELVTSNSSSRAQSHESMHATGAACFPHSRISDLCLGSVNHPQQAELPTSINLTKVNSKNKPTGKPNLHCPQWPPRTCPQASLTSKVPMTPKNMPCPQASLTSTFLSDPQEHAQRSA